MPVGLVDSGKTKKMQEAFPAGTGTIGAAGNPAQYRHLSKKCNSGTAYRSLFIRFSKGPGGMITV
jgi:hypothetical protein